MMQMILLKEPQKLSVGDLYETATRSETLLKPLGLKIKIIVSKYGGGLLFTYLFILFSLLTEPVLLFCNSICNKKKIALQNKFYSVKNCDHLTMHFMLSRQISFIYYHHFWN